jgi:hypothetical protein
MIGRFIGVAPSAKETQEVQDDKSSASIKHFACADALLSSLLQTPRGDRRQLCDTRDHPLISNRAQLRRN